MKKITLMLLSMLCCSVYAQSLSWGVTAGAVFSEPTGSYENDGGRWGVTAGVRGEYGLPRLSQGLFASIGMNLCSKNFKSATTYIVGEDDSNPSYLHHVINLNYVEIPLRIGYKFGNEEKIRFFAEAGPYVSYAAWGKKVSYLNDSKEQSTSDIFGQNGFRHFDLGLGFSLGLQLNNHWQLSAGYERGLMQLFRQSSVNAYKSVTYYNSSMHAGITYIF